VVWCNLNSESEALRKAIPDAVEIRGNQTPDEKERGILAFTEGRARVTIQHARIQQPMGKLCVRDRPRIPTLLHKLRRRY